MLSRRVLKTTTTTDSLDVDVWYTPEIPVPAGPGRYIGLPGLILSVVIGDGDETFVATEIVPQDEVVVEPPNKGETVSREEFERIAAEKTREAQKALSRMLDSLPNF